VVAFALTVPLIAVGSTVMTIDAPYTCCWAWALVLAHRAVFRGSWWAWPAAGVLVGLGILAKYTMVLFLPSFALFLLATPEQRRLLRTPGPWLLALTACLCCLPILVWNAQHDWVTVRHVLRLAGLVRGEAQGFHIQWLGPLAFLGGQAALLLVFWFIAWVAAMVAHNPLSERDAAANYLWWMSAPMFLVFLGFSFKTGGGEINWPVTAYLSGVVLTASWLANQLTSPVGWYRRCTTFNLALTCTVGLALTLYAHHSHSLYPLLADLLGQSEQPDSLVLRRIDPTCRLRGWRTLAAEMDKLREQVRQETGAEPVLAGTAWTVPGALGVYCAGHPQAYSVGLAVGDRHSQYDLWPGPLTDPAAFRGRTFLVIGDPKGLAEGFKEGVGPSIMVMHRERGYPVSMWQVTVCRDYQGFPTPTEAPPH
jgi:hypothetical protein